jgi:hypothetical protein
MKKLTAYNADFYQSELEFTFPVDSNDDKQFINCDFSSLMFKGDLDLRDSYRNCVFVNCDFEGVTFKGKFENCNFTGSVFEGSRFEKAEFNRCELSGTIFRNCIGIYSSKFKNTCKFEFTQGLSIGQPDTDEGILIVSNQVSNGVPNFVKTEKTEKVETDNVNPYDSYDLSGVKDVDEEAQQGHLWDRSPHGRKIIGFSASRRNRDVKPIKMYTSEKRNVCAILICSREGLI